MRCFCQVSSVFNTIKVEIIVNLYIFKLVVWGCNFSVIIVLSIIIIANISKKM